MTIGLAVAALQAPIVPINATEIVAVVMGLMVVLIPIAGLTARFALKPIAEAVARMREGQGASRELSLIEKRLSLMEQQLQTIETDLHQLEDKARFDRQLASAADGEEG